MPTPDNIHPVHLKIKQLADDTTLFLKNREDMLKSREIFEQFEKFSGLKMNVHKTKALRIGRHLENGHIPFTIVNRIKILGIYFQSDKMAKEIKDNWTGRIEQVNALIKEWSKRDLSIVGKVVVIKTFLLSQFTYVMQSIGLPHHVLSKINTILYKFLWQKKQSNRKAFEKVKRKVMEADFDAGGVKMINMVTLQKCFYLQWAGKLSQATKQHSWKWIPKFHIEKLAKGNNILYINCKLRDIKGLDRIDNEFWKEVIRNYVESKTVLTHLDVSSSNFQSQLIFNNALITYKNKTLFFQTWHDKGIEQIRHIIDHEKKRLLSLEEIQQLLGTNKAQAVLEYNILINSIPKAWIRWIQAGEKELNTLACDVSRYNTKPRNIKTMLPEYKTAVTPCASQFWHRKFSVCLDKSAWSRAREVTKETRLLVLHWKILHNIYPTNILLNKMEIAENNKCSYCRGTVDYIEHFFFECPIVRSFWGYIEQKIYINTNNKLILKDADVLFGVSQTDIRSDHFKYINFLILLGKMCISIYKKTKSTVKLDNIFEKEFELRKYFI